MPRWILALSLVGCAEHHEVVPPSRGGCPELRLGVVVQSDYRPGAEAAAAELLVDGSRVGVTRLGPAATLLEGTRIALLCGLEAGTHSVQVILRTEDDEAIRERRVVIDLQRNQDVRVLLARDEGSCSGECSVDLECPSFGCVTGACLGCACFRIPEDAMCPAGVACDPADGRCDMALPCACEADSDCDAAPGCLRSRCEDCACVTERDDARCDEGTCQPDGRCAE